MNIFNSVKGLHPKRNKFTADTYRNDFTAPLGVNIPCFWAEVPPATRIKVSASALVRLQALIAPVMDNIDYYTHFWKVPYRILEDDRFTKFISGEILPEEYDALFVTPYTLADAIFREVSAYAESLEDYTEYYNRCVGDGSILDFLGYDKSLFPTPVYIEADDRFELQGGNNTDSLNWRGLIVYFLIHQNWYMNENVPYFEDFNVIMDDLVKEQDDHALARLIVYTAKSSDWYCSFLPHGWDKDYFTSALPNVQFGEPVTIPIAGTAPVTINTIEELPVELNGQGLSGVIQVGLNNANEVNITDTLNLQANITQKSLDGTSAVGELINTGYQQNPLFNSISGNLSSTEQLEGQADLSEATAITINELRFANALQIFKERQMRFGRRRLEYYKGFFDVEPEDLRLQVPKYLGGGRIPINIADIEQTSATTGSQVLGHLAGKATAVAGGFAGFSTFCSEETYIIGISFAMPHQTYGQQLSRFKLKTNDPYDYFNPSFEHLGEQPVYNIELFPGTDNPKGEFGYQPRYTEYRFHNNEMHGDFKNTLAYWTLGRLFSETPALNAEFVYMQPRVFDRIFAVSGQPNMLVSMLFHTRAIKPVSKYGTPMLLS